MEPGVYVSWHHLDPALSAIVVFVAATLPLLTMGLLAGIATAVHARLARAADRLYDPDAPVTPGPAVMLGKVIQLPGCSCAVRVEITQRGVERLVRGRWRHVWEEIERHTTVHPFNLRLASGEEIRVEPDARVVLIDQLDRIERMDRTTATAATAPGSRDPAPRTGLTRTRIAELSPREAVYVVGRIVIEQAAADTSSTLAYRDLPPLRALRPPSPAKSGRMLIASEQLGARFHRRLRFHGIALLIAGAGLSVLHGVVFRAYHHHLLRGTAVLAQVSAKSTSLPSPARRFDAAERHPVWAEAPPPWGLQYAEASAATFSRLRVGDTVPLLLVAGEEDTMAQLGSQATVNRSAAWLGLLGWGMLGGYVSLQHRMRPWYERRKVVDRGNGRL